MNKEGVPFRMQAKFLRQVRPDEAGRGGREPELGAAAFPAPNVKWVVTEPPENAVRPCKDRAS